MIRGTKEQSMSHVNGPQQEKGIYQFDDSTRAIANLVG